MSSKLEEVARAIAEEMLKPAPAYDGPVDPMAPARRIAKAAILAMREPSDKMLSATLFLGNGPEVELYQAMIDAALDDQNVE